MIKNNYSGNYQDIYCFQIIEEYDIKRNYNILKMIYSYIFAPAIPISEHLDDEKIKSNYTFCKKLLIKIWVKNQIQPILISFLPTKKTIYVKSHSFKRIYALFTQIKEELIKNYKNIYGSNYEKILSERISKIQKQSLNSSE